MHFSVKPYISASCLRVPRIPSWFLFFPIIDSFLRFLSFRFQFLSTSVLNFFPAFPLPAFHSNQNSIIFNAESSACVIFGNYPFRYILLLRKIYFWETYNLIYVYSEFSFIDLWINLKWQAIFIVKFIIIKIYTKMYKKFSDKTIRILLLLFIKFG